jgi:hypothetical protein
MDIFENTFDGLNCMLVVVEFMQGGDLLTLFEANGRNPYSEKCLLFLLFWVMGVSAIMHIRRCPNCSSNWLGRSIPAQSEHCA